MQVKLKVLQGSQAGKEIKISVESFVVGRDSDCQLRARSDLISRRHCEIAIEDGEVVARDLGSRNGTYVNGERIEGDCQVNVGDHLRVGRLEFEIRIDHSVAGPKRSRVESVKEAATRTVEDRGQADDVSSWLEEADEKERVGRQVDPETRQFKLDETDRVALESASATKESDDVKKEDVQKEDTDVESVKKKAPGKLPKRQLAASVDSSAAATDMLKKMFNRR